MAKKLNIPSEKKPEVSVTRIGIDKESAVAKALDKVSEKLDTINNSIMNKAESFEFDIARDSKGYINKVYVKPTK